MFEKFDRIRKLDEIRLIEAEFDVLEMSKPWFHLLDAYYALPRKDQMELIAILFYGRDHEPERNEVQQEVLAEKIAQWKVPTRHRVDMPDHLWNEGVAFLIWRAEHKLRGTLEMNIHENLLISQQIYHRHLILAGF